jgi:hypothetical protein
VVGGILLLTTTLLKITRALRQGGMPEASDQASG